MKSGPFIQLIADALGVELGTTKVVARSLREAGWLTTGPRGTNAPDMNARDASRLIIALMTGAAPSRALPQFEKFRALKPSGKQKHDELATKLATKQVDTLDDCLARFIELLIEGEDAGCVVGTGDWIVNFELLINETSRIAVMSIGRESFCFLDLSTPQEKRNQGNALTAPTTPGDGAFVALNTRALMGIQAIRSITFTEIENIANGLSGRIASGNVTQTSSTTEALRVTNYG